MKKKNIDKKVALSIGGLSVLCLGLLFGAWYLSHEPEESFTPAAQEVETLAETWDDKLDSGIPEASIKEESLYTGEVSDNTQTVISEDENGSNVDSIPACVAAVIAFVALAELARQTDRKSCHPAGIERRAKCRQKMPRWLR